MKTQKQTDQILNIEETRAVISQYEDFLLKYKNKEILDEPSKDPVEYLESNFAVETKDFDKVKMCSVLLGGGAEIPNCKNCVWSLYEHSDDEISYAFENYDQETDKELFCVNDTLFDINEAFSMKELASAVRKRVRILKKLITSIKY